MQKTLNVPMHSTFPPDASRFDYAFVLFSYLVRILNPECLIIIHAHGKARPLAVRLAFVY